MQIRPRCAKQSQAPGQPIGPYLVENSLRSSPGELLNEFSNFGGLDLEELQGGLQPGARTGRDAGERYRPSPMRLSPTACGCSPSGARVAKLIIKSIQLEEVEERRQVGAGCLMPLCGILSCASGQFLLLGLAARYCGEKIELLPTLHIFDGSNVASVDEMQRERLCLCLAVIPGSPDWSTVERGVL